MEDRIVVLEAEIEELESRIAPDSTAGYLD